MRRKIVEFPKDRILETCVSVIMLQHSTAVEVERALRKAKGTLTAQEPPEAFDGVTWLGRENGAGAGSGYRGFGCRVSGFRL